MELRQLEYLIAVAEEASFSGAARRLGVQQPSVSEQIKKLEAQVHQPLLDRLPKRVVPTAAGQQLIEHGRRILAELAEAKRRVADSAGEVRGSLVVGAIPTIAPFLLPQLVRPFERQYPQLSLTVIEDTTPMLIGRLERGEIDVAVASSAPPTPTLHEQTIAEEPLLLMLPAGHPLSRRRQVEWSSLVGERFVALHEMHCLAGQSARVCARHNLHPPVVMYGSNLLTLAAMVTAGMGITLVPRMMAQCSRCRVRGVTFRPIRKDPPIRPITLLWSLLRYRPVAARAFAAAAERYLKAGE
jgi:LysR family transcriptional regulator, hydrogen peroxide-inducible genes activator